MTDLLDPFARMLDAALPAAVVRTLESGGDAAPIWQALVESGFLDALVDEDHGGVGLTLAEVMPLIMALGARAVPLPVAETMVARALLASAGVAAPEGPIAIATSTAWPVSGGLLADHVLIDDGASLYLCSAETVRPVATGARHDTAARLTGPVEGMVVARPEEGLRPVMAVLRAGLIAGAAERVTEMSAEYANSRVQFGKPIGKQQAMQQMLSVMAEDMVACRLAAQLGASDGLRVSPVAAATAKITTSAAAARLANSAHAVHGAIGISEEYDLQLLTRRLHEWRMVDGSEGWWSQALGMARLGSPLGTVDWVRAELFA